MIHVWSMMCPPLPHVKFQPRPISGSRPPEIHGAAPAANRLGDLGLQALLSCPEPGSGGGGEGFQKTPPPGHEGQTVRCNPHEAIPPSGNIFRSAAVSTPSARVTPAQNMQRHSRHASRPSIMQLPLSIDEPPGPVGTDGDRQNLPADQERKSVRLDLARPGPQGLVYWK